MKAPTASITYDAGPKSIILQRKVEVRGQDIIEGMEDGKKLRGWGMRYILLKESAKRIIFLGAC